MNVGTGISIALSAVALLVSGATFYLTLLRKKAALVGCLLSTMSPDAGDNDDWRFEFALANTGNVELLVREAALDPLASGLAPEISSLAFPYVIKPGEVAPLEMELPKRFCREVIQTGEQLAFNFHVFSSRGVPYVARTSVALTEDDVEPPKANWVPFTLGRAIR